MNQPENSDSKSSGLLNKLPQEIRERIFILSGVPHHQLVQCFSGMGWIGVIPRNEQTQRLRKLDEWSVGDEPPNCWGLAPLGPRAGPYIWSSPVEFFSRRASRRYDLHYNYVWDLYASFPPIVERDPTPTTLAVACSQLRDEVESLIYSRNTLITFLDWEVKLSNTIKTRLSPNNQAKIRKLIVFVPYGTIESIRLPGNLEGGFLPETMANLNMLCIVITQPFILTTAEKQAWRYLLAKKLLPHLILGLDSATRVFVDANWETAAMDAVKGVLGPDRCCFQNMNVVDYLGIYLPQRVGVWEAGRVPEGFKIPYE